MRFSATLAPTPTDEPLIVPGSAFAAAVLSALALKEMSPSSASTVAPLAIVAVVSRFPISSAKEPATPSAPPPAPEVA
jgi:hypothetical protein